MKTKLANAKNIHTMNVNFLKKHYSNSKIIVNEAIRELKSYKLARISEILKLNSGTIHNWITKKSNLSPSRAIEILLQLKNLNVEDKKKLE